MIQLFWYYSICSKCIPF